ncbi:hypothetical protein LEMLEM_LOCUS20152 [Lemmus lemmus]
MWYTYPSVNTNEVMIYSNTSPHLHRQKQLHFGMISFREVNRCTGGCCLLLFSSLPSLTVHFPTSTLSSSSKSEQT